MLVLRLETFFLLDNASSTVCWRHTETSTVTLAATHHLPPGLGGELHQVRGDNAVVGGQGPDPELVVPTQSHEAEPWPRQASDHVSSGLLAALVRGEAPRHGERSPHAAQVAWVPRQVVDTEHVPNPGHSLLITQDIRISWLVIPFNVSPHRWWSECWPGRGGRCWRARRGCADTRGQCWPWPQPGQRGTWDDRWQWCSLLCSKFHTCKVQDSKKYPSSLNFGHCHCPTQ